MTLDHNSTALYPVEGDWFWSFIEDSTAPSHERRLAIHDGKVTEAELPCTVTLEGGQIRLRLNDGTSELRFDPAAENDGAIPATFWALPDGLDDVGDGAAMELLQDAALIRA